MEITGLMLLSWAALFVIGVMVYAWTIREVARRGGRVATAHFAVADLVVVLLLSGWFVAMIRGSVFKERPPITGDDLLFGTIFFGVIVLAIAAFLMGRGIHLREVFGVRVKAVPGALAAAFVLAGAAYPLVMLAGVLAQKFLLHESAKPQEIVEFFLRAREGSEFGAVTWTIFLAVIVAPALEEFIFRGYIYGVFKRHGGTVAAVLLSSALFAAIHLNLASMGGLFVLAICLTLAYELTGSLLVPILMHAFFNLVMLLLLFFVQPSLP